MKQPIVGVMRSLAPVSSDTAKFERRWLKAKEDHDAAIAKENGISARLDEISQRQSKITDNRVNGNASPADANEYAALTGDRELLTKMLKAAKGETAEAAVRMETAANNYRHAENATRVQQAQAEFEALHAKCQEIEKVFVACIGATARAGRAIGHSTLGTSYKISQPLDFALRLNVIPSEEA